MQVMKYLNLKSVCNRSFLIIAVICCCSIFAKAQTDAKTAKTPKVAAVKLPPPATITSIVDTFFKKYKEDGTSPAIDYLFATNKLFTDTVQIGVLKSKLDALRQSVGDYTGRELIIQKSTSPSLVFYSYLVKHDKSPIRFTFMFYKPHNEWVLYRFKYDDQMDAELEEAGKINNKRP
jgi:hypothetical protein